MSDIKDPYQVLGITRTASTDDIRRAYRKLARATHPDVKPGDRAAEERFKEVSAAYDILSDAKRRRLYDEFGPVGLREGFDAEQARAFSQQGGGFAGGGAGFGAGGFDLGDLFGDFFGNRTSTAGPARGGDVTATVEVTLPEALRGTEVTLQVPFEADCGTCRGSGAQPGARPTRCEICRGSGQVTPPGLPGSMRMRCSQCSGRGQSVSACPSCHGKKTMPRQEQVKVRIPAGAAHRSKLRVPGRGAVGRGGRGDLLLETLIKGHPWFRREGLDLWVRLPLTIREAVCGAQVQVPTPSGEVTLRVPAGAQPGLRLRLRGRGVTRGKEQGDLFAEIEVRMPDRIDEKTQALAQSLDEGYSQMPRQELHL